MSSRWLFWPTQAAGGEQELVVSIAAGSDDAVETNSTDVMQLTAATVTASINFTPAFRFTTLTIPQGATIVEATIQFTSNTSQAGAITMTVSGHATDNAGTFTTTAGDISTRTRTTATVSWVDASVHGQ